MFVLWPKKYATRFLLFFFFLNFYGKNHSFSSVARDLFFFFFHSELKKYLFKYFHVTT